MAFDTEDRLTHLARKVKVEGRSNITLHPVLLEPATVVGYLEKNAAAEDLRQMGFLKVDIDSSDCDLAEAILRAGYRPVVLQIEFANMWPVGIRMRAGPKNQLSYGCSCAEAAELGRRYGYRLVSPFGIDATMVRKDVLDRIRPKLRFATAAYCSPSCGSSYCRTIKSKRRVRLRRGAAPEVMGLCNLFAVKWLDMARRAEWDALVHDVAKEAAPRGFAGLIAHDFSGRAYAVGRRGRVSQVRNRNPEYVLKGRYAVPWAPE